MSIYKDYWTKPMQSSQTKPITKEDNRYVDSVMNGKANLCKRESILSE